ncbi:hypothetical protein QUF70_18265, partial [Desulfobacterales bacterium HSG17]|nr:hypothetical protein [Desulfobacterales bacterium HSG17]
YIAQELPATDQKTKKIIMVIKSLLKTLDREKQVFKNMFPSTFKDYAAFQNKKAFNKLFKLK